MQLPRDVLFRKGKHGRNLGKTPPNPRLIEIRLPAGCAVQRPFEDWLFVTDMMLAYGMWAYREGEVLCLFPLNPEQANLFLEVA